MKLGWVNISSFFFIRPHPQPILYPYHPPHPINEVLWITIICDKCHSSSATATPVKFERDVKLLTGVLAMVKNWENNGTQVNSSINTIPGPICFKNEHRGSPFIHSSLHAVSKTDKSHIFMPEGGSSHQLDTCLYRKENSLIRLMKKWFCRLKCHGVINCNHCYVNYVKIRWKCEVFMHSRGCCFLCLFPKFTVESNQNIATLLANNPEWIKTWILQGEIAWPQQNLAHHSHVHTGIILGMGSANGRRHNTVTLFPIGWARSQNDPCLIIWITSHYMLATHCRTGIVIRAVFCSDCFPLSMRSFFVLSIRSLDKNLSTAKPLVLKFDKYLPVTLFVCLSQNSMI